MRTRCPSYRGCEGLRPTGASNYALHSARVTNLSCSTPCFDHLQKPTLPPRLHANKLGRFPGLAWRYTPGQSRSKRREGNRQVRLGAHQRHSRGHSGICSQASAPCRPAFHFLSTIQDELRPNKWLRRQWQVTTDLVLEAQNNRHQSSVTYRLNMWNNELWSDAL
jgi:hypothetical protein